MKIARQLEQSKTFWFLFIISFVFFLLRFPSLFEPYWYGDEGIYHVLGDAMNNGRILYKEIWDNKPPLLYLIYSVLNSDQFIIRFASLITGTVSVILFFFLSRKIFKNSKIQYLTTILFALLFGLPILEGNIANSENFMLAPIIGSAILILKSKKGHFLLFTCGFLLSIAFLFKIVAIFDFLAFLIFLLFIDNLKNKNTTKKLIYFVLGFLIPILGTSLYFTLNNALDSFLSATLFANVSYVGYGNKFFIPQGLLLLKLALLIVFSLFIILRKKLLEKEVSFLLIWFGFSLFNAFFSQRPYTHYLLVLLPSFVLLSGLLFDNKYKKLAFPIFILAIFFILYNFGFYGKTIFYYQNYIAFLSGSKNTFQYNKFFDRRTLTDYELAGYINIHTDRDDSIFIWGNNAQVYTLTKKLPPGKFAVAYHITSAKNGIKETSMDLERVKPRLVLLMPYMKYFPFALHGYVQKVIIDGVVIYERI